LDPLASFSLVFFIFICLEFFNFAIGESFLILWLRLAWCPLFSVVLVLISVDGLEFFNFAIGESFLILWLRLAWCSLFSFAWSSLISPLVNHSLSFGFVWLGVFYFFLGLL